MDPIQSVGSFNSKFHAKRLTSPRRRKAVSRHLLDSYQRNSSLPACTAYFGFAKPPQSHESIPSEYYIYPVSFISLGNPYHYRDVFHIFMIRILGHILPKLQWTRLFIAFFFSWSVISVMTIFLAFIRLYKMLYFLIE